MAVHGAASLGDVGGVTDHAGTLSGVEAAGKVAAGGRAVVVNDYHADVAHQLRVVDERVEHRVDKGQEQKEDYQALVVNNHSQLTHKDLVKQ